MPHKLARSRESVIPYRETRLTSDDTDLLIGRAVRRLAELAAGDDVLQAGLEAFARAILGLSEPQPAISPEAAQLPSHAALEPQTAEASDLVAEEPPAPEPPLEEAPPAGPEADDTVEPMDRAAFMKLMEEVARQVEATALGTVAASLRGATGVAGPLATEGEGRDADAAPAIGATAETRTSTAAERDAVLPGITERTRLKAEPARAVEEHARAGTPIDGQLVHRARSAHCSLWVLELAEPDPDAITDLAKCLAAVSDAAELIALLREHDPDNRERILGAVRGLAAVQSALRIAVSRLRRVADDDQISVFGWLKDTTKAEEIFVARHMKLDDPLDPDDLPDAVAPICAELETVREGIDRQESRTKGLRQVRYHAGRIAKGKGSEHDCDKIVEAVVELVGEGLPPSNLELRALLLPVFDRLPDPDGRPAAYGRVFADVELNRERRPRLNGKEPATRKKVYSEEIRRAAHLLRGTELIVIGGERRVEAEHALTDALGLSELTWFTLSDDPTLDDLERAISRPEVSVVVQLIRWSRHRHGDAAELAEEHGKPFVRIPGGCNPNAIARAILDQASERLGER